MVVATDRINALFADAREMYRSALARLETGDMRDAAERTRLSRFSYDWPFDNRLHPRQPLTNFRRQVHQVPSAGQDRLQSGDARHAR